MQAFIKRCIAYIKEKLHKQKHYEEIKEEPQPTTHTTYTDEQYELFKNCVVGDMLWALMPLSQQRLDNIPKDHQIRPYLIVKKTKDALLAYASTSTFLHMEVHKYYCYHRVSHGTQKLAYIRLHTLHSLPIANLRNFMMHLQEHELMEIEKRLLLNKQEKQHLVTLNIPIYVKRGDVISVQEKQSTHAYYIYHDDQQNLYGLYLSKGAQHNAIYTITLQSTPYVVDFQRKVVISKKESITLIGLLNPLQQEEITNIQKSLRRKHKNEKQNKLQEKIMPIHQNYGYRFLDINGEEYMFLYAWHDAYYGVCLTTFHHYPQIVRIKKKLAKFGKYKDDEIINIMQSIVDENLDIHHQVEPLLSYYKHRIHPA